ncbi:MAG: dipeptidase [Deinococcales bacterium]
MMIDAHLDLAFSAQFYKRDLLNLMPNEIRAREIRDKLEYGQCTVTLPAMRQAGVALAFATLFAEPAVQWTTPGVTNPHGYSNPEEAHAQALAQLALYEDWEARKAVRIVKSRADLEHHLLLWQRDRKTGLVILMEGADPVRQPEELEYWFKRGVRILGTSWGRTRYAGGTEMPGGLTDIGRDLVAGVRDLGLILDASHQSWEAFWESIALGTPKLIASHSNAFALRPTTNRHLTDAMLGAIAARDGRVGVVLLNSFLEPRWTRQDRRVPVTFAKQVRAHLEHMAGIIGWERVGIGSDSDGGFGAAEAPAEYDTIADLQKIADIVPQEHAAGVLGGNWLTYLQKNLP